jgi:hypothetical protein
MGGSAFAVTSGFATPLHTPRMHPEVYEAMRDKLLLTLRTIFEQAETPIEAPGKSDYGDIDILVAVPRKEFTMEELAKAIGGARHKSSKRSRTTHFAVPWPSEKDRGVLRQDPNNIQGGLEWYIQVDVHVCSKESFVWELFHQSHGDLWNIIGSTIRPFGLTPNNVGLYLRIASIEARDKKKSLVFLTNSPERTLEYLGLDVQKWKQPFKSLQDMYDYAATCRFFSPKVYKDKSDLKSNDRQRCRKRIAFRIWVEEYLPEHRDRRAGSASQLARDDVIEEAKAVFNVEKECDRKLSEWKRKTEEEQLWRSIKESIPRDNLKLSRVTRDLRNELKLDNSQESNPQSHLKAFRDGDFEAVRKWAMARLKDLESRQRALDQEASAEKRKE